MMAKLPRRDLDSSLNPPIPDQVEEEEEQLTLYPLTREIPRVNHYRCKKLENRAMLPTRWFDLDNLRRIGMWNDVERMDKTLGAASPFQPPQPPRPPTLAFPLLSEKDNITIPVLGIHSTKSVTTLPYLLANMPSPPVLTVTLFLRMCPRPCNIRGSLVLCRKCQLCGKIRPRISVLSRLTKSYRLQRLLSVLWCGLRGDLLSCCQDGVCPHLHCSCCIRRWPLHQLDVKNAFLNGILEEEIYITQPPGFVVQKEVSKVCRLKRSLYDLNQSPRAWLRHLSQVLSQFGITRSASDHSVFYKHLQEKTIILVTYVDDLIITDDDAEGISPLKKFLSEQFQIIDLDKLKYFLCIEVLRSSGKILICERKYALDMLSECGLLGCKPI
ncbi:Retrovirus-related Pol polyprotein from transposon RE1-like protein [Drosera capensis]